MPRRLLGCHNLPPGRRLSLCRRLGIVLTSTLAVLILTGCAVSPPIKAAGYFGPTESMPQVIQQINRNNHAITSLWASHDFEADIADENGQRHFINGDGELMFRQADDLRIIGRKPALPKPVFDIGANGQRYWLLLPTEIQRMWWGYFDNLSKPCVDELPIRPDLLLQVLGVGLFNDDLLHQPAPVMRFNNDADAYMFVWVYAASDHLIAQKEVWYDRKTHQPTLVLLFDTRGRIILRAYLSEHEPIAINTLAKDDLPMIATRYQLFFPDSKSTLVFKLHNPALSRRGFPKAASFAFPDNPPLPSENVIQVDANCTD
ncbi:MAG: hypothetical protein IT448_05045 [Phycisphaerales bacterium]|nr:hypothetical protein [Phycisphaerales bacterium]